MALAPGARLGPYAVLDLMGAGGMGEVYKARDTRLDRIVALKILPPEFSDNPDRRARFAREAKTISQLSHPHICALYDVGEAEVPEGAGAGFPSSAVGAGFSRPDVQYLVMEHLEGETLAARLDRGAMPLDKAPVIGTEMADALACAHRHGIVHRDLKPANVMLTASGVKLLDFGLARATSGLGLQPSGDGATTTDSLTGEGRVVGTVPYMAPEQVEGKDTDARTDIFALGCVLYELVTGRRAFAGDTSAAVMSAILKDDPPPLVERLPLAPPALDHVVRQCLAKDPDERWQSALDVKRELSWIGQQEATGATSREGRVRPPRRAIGRAVIIAGVAAAVGFAAAGLWFTRPGPDAAPAVTRAQVGAALASVRSFSYGRIALSPDGRAVAYEGQAPDGSRRIYLRALDADEPMPVPGTENGLSPFFSPDGRWLGFFALPEAMGASVPLRKVLLPSGPAEVIVPNVTNPGGAAWGPDDTIVFTGQDKGMALFRVPASGGAPVRLMEADPNRGEWFLLGPQLVPDGRAVLVTASASTCDSSRVLLQPLDGGPQRTLVEKAGDARVLPTGHLSFVRDGAVLVAPFDAAEARLLDPVIPLGETVSVEGLGCRFAAMSVSDNGVLAYLPPAGPGGVHLVWVDRSGRELPTNIGPPGVFGVGVRISPAGNQITALSAIESRSLAVVDLERNVTTRLTAGSSWWPIWSPDGTHVAFSMMSPGSANINVYWRRADAATPVEQLTFGDLAQNPRAFTPDGKTLIYQQHRDPETGFDVWSVSLEEGATPRPLLRERYAEYHASLSPNGRWLAYVSDESGTREVYVRPYPALDGMYKVSVEGGWAPAWSRDGRELYYLQQTGAGARVMAVRVDTSSGFHAAAPMLLFEGPYDGGSGYGQSYDVAPDGRFLMAKLDLPPPPNGIHLVLNWFEALKTRMQAAKQ